MSIVNDQFTILILIQFCRPNYYIITFLIPTIIISKNYIVYLNTYYVPPLGEYHMKQKRTEIFYTWTICIMVFMVVIPGFYIGIILNLCQYDIKK